MQLHSPEPGPEPGYLAAQELLSRKRPFSAIFSFNDVSAVGAISALREAGLQVPRDVSVVGFDDIPEAEFFRTPLTTVKQDFVTIGKVGVRMLIEQLSGVARSPKVRFVTPTFVKRCSTSVPSSRRR